MMAQTTPPGAADPEPIDHYHVDPGAGQVTRPVSHHVLGAINFLLLILMAATSFALFWVVATMLGFV